VAGQQGPNANVKQEAGPKPLFAQQNAGPDARRGVLGQGPGQMGRGGNPNAAAAAAAALQQMQQAGGRMGGPQGGSPNMFPGGNAAMNERMMLERRRAAAQEELGDIKRMRRM